MTKKEIKNIINKDWDSRRAECKEKSAENSQRTKNWKKREALGLPKIRKKEFTSSGKHPTNVSIHTSSRITLSLLVGVTYAPED
jgi:hypothetical protein